MTWKNRTSIITQTVLQVSFVFIIAFIFFTITISQLFMNSMKNRIIEDQQELVWNMSDTIEYTFESLTVPIVSLANYTPTQRLLRDYDEMYSADWLANIRNLNDYLVNVNAFNDFILDIAIIQPNSYISYSMTNQFDRRYDYVNSDWFKEAVEEEGLIKYAPPHGKDHLTNKVDYSFTAIYPITKSDTLLGYIIVEVDITRMADMFSRQAGNSRSGYLLVNQDGNIIFDYKRDRISLDSISQKFNSITEEEAKPFVNDNKLYIVKQLQSVKWFVLSEIDYSTITKPINDIFKIVVILICGCLIALFIIVAYATRILRRPFDLLIDRISSYEGSSSAELIELEKTPREILILRTKFEEMADKINDLINDVYIAQVHTQKMELQALTNQINPHFLYNVLQLIQTKAVLANNREIEEMITSLGSMLRYTMERTREKVSIEDEVIYIKNYLMFYKIRFSNMFTYDVSCDPDILNCKTIKFILQPIVENCMKHGFKDKKENGIIKINIVKQEEDILIIIFDNGWGIEPSSLELLNQSLENGQNGERIGVVNTHSRIKIVYGSKYGITISSKTKEYTKVTILIKNEGDTSGA